MKNVYRLNVRFDCADTAQKKLVEKLQSLQHGSINSIVIEAIQEHFERAEQSEILADIFRKVLREELQGKTFPASQEDVFESAAGNGGDDASVLEALAMFG